MPKVDDSIIKSLSKFTKINETKIKNYLNDNNFRTLIEHPETIKPTQNQLENFKNLKELSNIYNKLERYNEYQFEDTLDAIPFLNGEFENKFDKEHFIVLYLDEENKLLGSEKISTGTLNEAMVHPRDVMKQAIQYDSNKMILSHNHPSGDPYPSDADKNVTRRLENVAKLFDKKVIDHIIIGRNSSYSFREKGDIQVDYKIEKTSNRLHEKIYKKDEKRHIDLLNKFTKIPKTKLKEIFNEISIEGFGKNPQKYLENEDQLNNVIMLREVKDKYMNDISFVNMKKITGTNDAKDYVNFRYSNDDDINIVLYLDTKNTIIESQILPKNMTQKEEIKNIMTNAVLYDSNCFILATKFENMTHLQHLDNVDRALVIQKESLEIGIDLLDNVELNKHEMKSYLELKILEEKEIYNVNKEALDSFNKHDETLSDHYIHDREYKHLVNFGLSHYERVDEIKSADNHNIVYIADVEVNDNNKDYSNYKDLWEDHFKTDFIQDFNNFTLDELEKNKELSKAPDILNKLAKNYKNINDALINAKSFENSIKKLDLDNDEVPDRIDPDNSRSVIRTEADRSLVESRTDKYQEINEEKKQVKR